VGAFLEGIRAVISAGEEVTSLCCMPSSSAKDSELPVMKEGWGKDFVCLFTISQDGSAAVLTLVASTSDSAELSLGRRPN
jgi:hypothetical protein